MEPSLKVRPRALHPSRAVHSEQWAGARSAPPQRAQPIVRFPGFHCVSPCWAFSSRARVMQSSIACPAHSVKHLNHFECHFTGLS